METDTAVPAPEFTDSRRTAQLAGAFGAVDQAFAQFREQHRVPGIAFGVVVDGVLAHAGGHGVQAADRPTPAGPGSIFRIASMTKSFTAAAVLCLRDDGGLALDDAVGAHVPELAALRGPTTDSGPVTIRQLLTMAAGLVEDDPWADRHLAMPAAEFSEQLRGGIPFNHPPGIGLEYSNLGYAILGRVIETVSGQRARDVITERILRPLQMADTTWDADRLPEDRRAVGHRWEDGGWIPEPALPDGAFGPMGGLATTIVDFARYAACHLDAWPPRDGPETGPLRRASIREMHQPWRERAPLPIARQPPPGMRDGYGYGLFCGDHDRLGRVVAHSGGLPGFGSQWLALPDQGVAVVGFANLTYAPVREAVWAAVGALEATGALVPRRAAASPALTAARDAVMALYAAWDDASAIAIAADNFALDRPLEQRRQDLAALRATHGRCMTVGALRPMGALRGEWLMTCERGTLLASLMLTPTRPPRLQSLTMAPTEPEDPASPGA